MIWLLVPLVAVCMAYICRHVWSLSPALRYGPDLLGPPPVQPDPGPPPTTGPRSARDDLISLAIAVRCGRVDWDAGLTELRQPSGAP